MPQSFVVIGKSDDNSMKKRGYAAKIRLCRRCKKYWRPAPENGKYCPKCTKPGFGHNKTIEPGFWEYVDMTKPIPKFSLSK